MPRDYPRLLRPSPIAWTCNKAEFTLCASDPVTRPFACPEPGCYQRFKRKFTLKEHIKTHTGEKPFVCPERACGKTFTTSGNLARHKRLHPWLKPLVCSVAACGRSFSSEDKLEAHVKSHFDGSRSHRCLHPGCGKDFSTAGNLTRHIKQQHTPESPRVTEDAVVPVESTPVLTPTSSTSKKLSDVALMSPSAIDDDNVWPLNCPSSPLFFEPGKDMFLPLDDDELTEALAFFLD
ncbi:hypothetical protein PINS_up020259 [Pythium insidiosum]|nr:hypothetical protein PINS_up020259 [Pythium insidiosum]